MEQILTTAALIAGGVFAVWILFADPGGEDGKGEMNTALLGALLMIPVIILLIIGIALFLPVLLGIALLVFLVYAVYQAMRWFLTRERREKPTRTEKGGMHKAVRRAVERIKQSSRSVRDSHPVRSLRKRTAQTREAITNTGKFLKERTRRTVKKIRVEGPKRFHETVRRVRSSKPSGKNISESVLEVLHKNRERSVCVRESVGKRVRAPDEESDVRRDQKDRVPSKRTLRKLHASERSHAHDPLQNMRKIGWNTRKHLGEVYHHRRHVK